MRFSGQGWIEGLDNPSTCMSRYGVRSRFGVASFDPQQQKKLASHRSIDSWRDFLFLPLSLPSISSFAVYRIYRPMTDGSPLALKR